MVCPECQVFHAMPHPPPCIWVCSHDQSLQPPYLSLQLQLSRVLQQIEQYFIICLKAYLPRHVRPTCLAQRLSSLALSTCTSMVSPWSAAWGAAPLPPPMWRSHLGDSLLDRPQALGSGPPLLGHTVHSSPRPWQTSSQPR